LNVLVFQKLTWFVIHWICLLTTFLKINGPHY